MDRHGLFVCLAAWIAMGCQGTVDGSGSPGTASAGAGAMGGPVGGAGATPPSFEPLGGPTPITCDPAKRASGGRRLWRLTRQQYDNTVALLLGDDSHPAQTLNPEPGSAQG